MAVSADRWERNAAPPVPALTPKLAWWQNTEMAVLKHVVGPWRQRRRRDPLPSPLSGEETARRLFALPVSYWTYDFEPGVRHLGPMAQDFAAAFGLGNTNRKIHMVDANGVAVIAIQSLHRTVAALQDEVARLSARLEAVDPHEERVSVVSASEQTGPGSGNSLSADLGSLPGAHDGRDVMESTPPTADDDDVEGHRAYSGSDREVKEDITPVAWEESNKDTDEGDDVEGHRADADSDRDVKDDAPPVAGQESDTEADGSHDVTGHRFSSSDRKVKRDVTPVVWEESDQDTDEGDDVEGHRAYSGSDREVKEDITPVAWEESDGEADDSHDVGGHRVSSSDRKVKRDITPVVWEESADVEGDTT